MPSSNSSATTSARPVRAAVRIGSALRSKVGSLCTKRCASSRSSRTHAAANAAWPTSGVASAPKRSKRCAMSRCP
jgi:hypothetical protein